LKSQNQALEGVAVSVADRPSDTEVQVRVEYIYRERNEVQGVHLRKESSGWKIVEVKKAEQLQTPLPFGRDGVSAGCSGARAADSCPTNQARSSDHTGTDRLIFIGLVGSRQFQNAFSFQ